jgi:hypothetical protein
MINEAMLTTIMMMENAYAILRFPIKSILIPGLINCMKSSFRKMEWVSLAVRSGADADRQPDQMLSVLTLRVSRK